MSHSLNQHLFTGLKTRETVVCYSETFDVTRGKAEGNIHDQRRRRRIYCKSSIVDFHLNAKIASDF